MTKAAQLIDNLASADELLWPRDRWPAMRFDRPLGVGAIGGHGPIRYTIEAYEPGHKVVFRFSAPRGFHGTHGFELTELTPTQLRLRHTLVMQTSPAATLPWLFVFRPLHDALIEDALDRAESFTTATPLLPHPWSAWVRTLRWFIQARRNGLKRPQTAAVAKTPVER